MATKLGSDVGYRSGIYNGYKVIGTQTLGLRGLVLWLKFNEGSGNIAYDSSFYNNHGTIYGAVWTDGKFGKALSFDGVDDYVDISDSPELRGFSQATWIWWYRANNLQNSKFIRTGTWTYIFGIYSGKYYIELWNIAGDKILSWSPTTLPKTDEWVMVAITYNDSSDIVKLYIDGQLVESKTTTGDGPLRNDPLSYVKIGAYAAKARIFNGTIDEVRIYNRALSEEEIKMLMYNRIGAVEGKSL